MGFPVLTSTALLFSAVLVAPPFASPADSVEWLPLFDAARKARVVQRMHFGEPCDHGEGEPVASPPIERRFNMGRKELRRFARTLFRTLPEPGRPAGVRPQVSWDNPQLGLEVHFLSGADSVRVVLRQVWSTHFSGEISRSRDEVLLERHGLRGVPEDVFPAWPHNPLSTASEPE